MDIDNAKQIGAVTRQVRSGEHDGKLARSVVLKQTYPTSADDLWDAVTSAERIPRWLMPITGELKLGGRYQLVGNAGGTILVCERPKLLQVTWEYGGQVSWVTATIEAIERAAARLTIEHIAHPDERWSQFGPGAVGIGWDLMVLGLALHIATGRENVAEEGMKWAMSDQGKAFMRDSGNAWRDADIAGGADRDAAQAAADHTLKAYTGG